MVDGIRVTYYPDGKTFYSKHMFNHGIKMGASIRYYNNGQIFQHTHYEDGKRHGLTRKYYKDGKLLAEFEHENGNILPGLKEYEKDGTLVTSYPEIQFREVNHLASKNRIDLEMFCNEKNRGIKYFLLEQGNEMSSRIYLISENSTASMQFYLKPGEILKKKIEILAEIPTYLGNIMVKKLTYQLTVVNKILFL
jgi:antitoxin component YwqK of YwqJK toxin-antitoxin module